MVRVLLFTIFLFFLTGCVSKPSLEVRPNDQVIVELPSEMFSALRMRQGELLFVRDNQIIGFIKSDTIPETLSQDSEHPGQALFDSALEGNQKPEWLGRIPGARAFWVIGDDFTTIFIVPSNSPNSLVTFQGPNSYSEYIRINETSVQPIDSR